MKSCRDRKYEGCNQPIADEYQCCPFCGGILVSYDEISNVRMGDANAISGGVHSSDDHSKKDSDNEVNSNNETHTNSHNVTTTNNTTTTIYEAKRSESEILDENRQKYRLECRALFRDGLISKDGERQLRELQANLNLADELVLPIKEEMRQMSKTRKTQLSMTGLSDIRQTKSIIEQNTAPALQRQLVKLESWMQEYDDNTLKLMYYQMSSMLESIRYTNRYEDSLKDEYWEVYWVYIAYLLQHREKEATDALASLGRWHTYYPEQNDTVLLLAGRLMLNEPIEGIKQLRKQLTSHFTSDLQLLLDAIDELLEKDWMKEPIIISTVHSFYINTLFKDFVATQTAIGKSRLREIAKQKQIELEEEKRTRQAEQDRLNHIMRQKTLVLNNFYACGQIEKACQDAGVDFHTFNVWLEEDPIFASSYNELVHRMEVRKYEEAEKRRKEQEIEVATHRKKMQFKTLFEQNRCDVLKTCAELGISSAEYQEWRRQDSVFSDSINYIIRENQKVVDQQNRQKRAKIVRKVGVIIVVLAILLAIALGIKAIVDNNKEQKAVEKARIEQEENQKRVIKNQHESLINTFNDLLADINKAKDSSSPNVEEFNSALISLEKKLKEIQRFEASNPSVTAEYENLKQQCKNICEKLGGIFLNKSTDADDPNFLQNGPKWNGMKKNVESLISRL